MIIEVVDHNNLNYEMTYPKGKKIVKVLNKSDLAGDKKTKRINISAKYEQNLDQLISFIKNKSILFVGNSGAGKSTLTSKLIGKDLKTAALSNDQGVHTTSISSLYELENNTKIIDSPGMRDIEIDNYDSNQIILGFKEILEASRYCKFNDCNHINNDGCNVIKCLSNDEINQSRYNNFISFRDS